MLVLLLLACSEYNVAGSSEHLGKDEDTAGDTPEGSAGTPEGDDPGNATTSDPPDEEEDEPCETPHVVRIGLSADDWWEGWIDGQHFGGVEHWWQTEWTTFELECGTYTLAVYATDLHQAISGFIGIVEVDGIVFSMTGDNKWKAQAGQATGNWHDPTYDDSAWTIPQGCEERSATGWWGSSPTDLTDQGAWWVWSQDCLGLGDTSFRLTFSLP